MQFQTTTPALRILEPARKKLATVETQRIIECLDECIRRQELAASLLLILFADDEKLEKFSGRLGPELMDAIKMHKYVLFETDLYLVIDVIYILQ